LRPPGLRGPAGERLPSGVFRADGSIVDLNAPPPATMPAPNPTTAGFVPERQRPGAWVFGGILLNQFGHVMVETAARLWAVRQLLEQGVALQGVLFFQKKSNGNPEGQRLPATSAAFLAAFSPCVPIVCTSLPEMVDELYVPELGLSHTADKFVGLPEQRQFFRDCAARIEPETSGPQNIYVSRTGKGARGGHLFEADIEAAMSAAGYTIYHPQFHSIEDQIATYRGARKLVSIDGSALHLAATALPPAATVCVIARRPFFAWAIADQIEAFAGCKVTVIEAHTEVYNLAEAMKSPAMLQTVKGWSSSFVLTDFDRLGKELLQAGFVDQVLRWPDRSEADVEAALQKAGARSGDTMLRVPAELLRLDPYFGAEKSRVAGN
jgi:hypothetical protein